MPLSLSATCSFPPWGYPWLSSTPLLEAKYTNAARLGHLIMDDFADMGVLGARGGDRAVGGSKGSLGSQEDAAAGTWREMLFFAGTQALLSVAS